MEALLLLLVRHAEPVLQQDDAVFDQHPLEDRRLVQEAVVLDVGAVPHHVLDAGAVVPGAVHQHDLARRRAGAGRSAGSTSGSCRARSGAGSATMRVTRGLRYSDDPLDRRALARGIPPLEDDHDAGARRLHPRLHVDELRLQDHQLATRRASSPCDGSSELLRPQCPRPIRGMPRPYACSASLSVTPTPARRTASIAPVSELRRNRMPSRPDSSRALDDRRASRRRAAARRRARSSSRR